MRGMTERLTIGERVAWYRRRRGLSQEVLGGLVGRTPDWLSKVENNRIHVDRLSVVRSLADALDVSMGDLLAEPSLLEWTDTEQGGTVPALRAALMDYRQLSPVLSGAGQLDAPDLDALASDVADVWEAYQTSQYARVTRRLPFLLADAQAAVLSLDGDALARAHGLLAMSYQASAMTLTKIGEADLAWIAADRGLAAAQRSGDDLIVGSLFRSVTHALLSNGRFAASVQLTRDAGGYLQTSLASASPALLSVYGTLFLAGAMAAARTEDRSTTREFLGEADAAARRLGLDANHVWTAFGPTNVAIHRVSTAMELGDVQVAVDLGPRIDTRGMPVERRVRHSLEMARAYSAWNRRDDALTTLLEAERLAPEQVRYHYLARALVLSWIRNQRRRPSSELSRLAGRLRVA